MKVANHTRLLLETCKKWLIIILHAGVCVYVSNPVMARLHRFLWQYNNYYILRN